MNKFIIGMKKGISMGIAYIPFAFTFGLFASDAGFSLSQVGLMSFVLYAGNSQIIIVKLLKANSPIIQIIVAAIAVNLRYLLINIPIVKKQKDYPKKIKVLSTMLLTDEAVSYLSISNIYNAYETLGFGFSAYLLFGFASLLGIIFGNFIPKAYAISLNFILYAVFLYLLTQVLQLNIRYIYIVLITLFVKAILSQFNLSQPMIMLLSIIIGTLLSIPLKERINGKC